MRFSRRELMALGGAGLGTAMLAHPAFAQKKAGRRRKAKNIIFVVADGMPMSIPTMASHYRQIVEGKNSYWMSLLAAEDVRNALQDTRSLNSLVTDSSAAASTWGSGRRIWNGQVNCYPDGTPLRTLYNLLQAQGMRTGLVTTTTMTHATPSGFVIVHPIRDDEEGIAAQHLSRNVDVLLGGGNRFFAAERRKDKRDLYSEFARKGYDVVRDRSSLSAAKGKRLLGIFADSHLPYTVDRKHSDKLSSTVPTLAQMTRKAIQVLDGGPNGFILQVEGGRVDHGNHASDLPASIFDQIEFEEAVKVVVDFARADGETMVVITSDHACGGTALNGYGDEYIESTAGLKTLAKMKCSWTNLLAEIRLDAKVSCTQELVQDRLGIPLKKEEAEAIVAAIGNKSPFQASQFLRSASATLGVILGNATKVTFTSGNHTSDNVLLTALGPGTEDIHGVIANYSLFDTMLEARGIRFENPKQMSFDVAYRHYYKDKKPDAESEAVRLAAHWE